jgi:hypothetical protein
MDMPSDEARQPQKDTTSVPLDKLALEHYLRWYDRHVFRPFADRPIKLLEIGVAKGDSMLFLRDRLPKATIVGLDIKLPEGFHDDSGRVHLYQGEQQDTELLDRLAREQAPGGFDVIIDDGSHVGQYTRLAFWHLFEKHLKPGGLYFIEDWGCSYWKVYPDGSHYHPRAVDFAPHEKLLNALHRTVAATGVEPLRKLTGFLRYRLVARDFPSHQRGMVGFIKELVDECGAADMTDPRFGAGTPRKSRIEYMQIGVGMVMCVKQGGTPGG